MVVGNFLFFLPDLKLPFEIFFLYYVVRGDWRCEHERTKYNWQVAFYRSAIFLAAFHIFSSAFFFVGRCFCCVVYVLASHTATETTQSKYNIRTCRWWWNEQERENTTVERKKIAFNHATVYNVLCIVLCAWNIDFCRFNSPNCEWKMVTYYWIFPPAFVVVIGAGLMQSILSFFFIFILRFLHHWPCDWSIGINRWPKREHTHAHGLQSSTVAQFCLIIFPTITGVGMYFFFVYFSEQFF